MIRLPSLVCLFLLLGCAPSEAHSEDSPEAQILKRDFTRMMDMFPGRYDNQEQVYFEDDLGVTEENRHERIHHIFSPAQLDNFPGTTFYIQQYQNDNPEDIYRQRIYSFEPDYEENAIRLTIYIPKDPNGLIDAHEDMSKLEGLTPAQFETLEGLSLIHI